MKVLITGASGYVAQHLIPTLVSQGHQVYATYHQTPPTTSQATNPSVNWIQLNLESGIKPLEPVDVIIHAAKRTYISFVNIQLPKEVMMSSSSLFAPSRYLDTTTLSNIIP